MKKIDIKSEINNLHSKYRKQKDKIPNNIGKIIAKVSLILLMFIFLIFIPIMFTTLSTLVGNGVINKVAYDVVFYTTWAVAFLSLLVWTFFKEYSKNK